MNVLHHQEIERAFRLYRRSLVAYAAGILGGDTSRGEEAVSDAFIDLWHKDGSLSDKDNTRRWIMRVVRNKAIDIVRKGLGREVPADPGTWENIPDNALCPEGRLLRENEAGWIRQALSALNGEQREAIVLCYFEGLSGKEISEIMGCPEGTVKTRLLHARRKLRHFLENAEVAAKQVTGPNTQVASKIRKVAALSAVRTGT